MWKLYKWNGHYIMGDLVSKHSSEDAALKNAAKELSFTFAEKTKKNKETLIWLDDKNHTPIGVIVKKFRG
jgi:aromatic ring hydroxylase|tara:strand:+ start:1421 stop:1630 length:210 start_codon:yes stop_codon:yes gene_type:complete